MKAPKKKGRAEKRHHVTLQMVADHVGLTKGTCSAVLNKSAASRSVPPHTQERILRAAHDLNYRPSFYARNLGVKRTFMIGVVTQEIGDFYSSPIISGIERYLRQKDYFFLTVAHRDDPRLLETYSRLLLDRGVEGFITVDTFIPHPLPLPAIAIPGHRRIEGVTNIVLDHRKAAWLAVNHLVELGHKEIAFMKGSDESPDAKDRWKAIREVAEELGIPIRADLIVQLEGRDATPQLGYPFARNYWLVDGVSQLCLPIMTFPRLVPSLPFKRLGCVFPRTSPWWDSTISELPCTTTRVSLQCASRSKRWARSQRAPC